MITKLEPWITKGLPEEEIERQHNKINELIEAVNKLEEKKITPGESTTPNAHWTTM